MLLSIDVEYPDRPAPDALLTLEAILRVITDHRQPVSFFVQGRWAVAHPELVAEMGRLDPDLGLHGYSHVNQLRLSPEGLDQEITQGLDVLRTILPGHVVRFYRFPHGKGGDDAGCLNVLARHNLTAVGWDHASRDWDVATSDDGAWENVQPASQQGGVVLFHSWVPRSTMLISRLLDERGSARAVGLRDMPLPHQASTGRVYCPVVWPGFIRL
jgi:peptidoglycan/xylan/chitin deacetylase (PgdA/CDA1 family)